MYKFDIKPVTPGGVTGSQPKFDIKPVTPSVPDYKPKANDIFSRLADMTKSAMPFAQAASTFMTAGPMGVAAKYAQEHPKETMEAAGSTVKAFAQSPIQLTKGLAAEYAGLTGDETTRTELLKPQTYPILGEVKQISAAPEDIAKSQTQTPGQTALQAIELGAMGEGIGPRTVLGRTPGRVIAESKPGQYVTEKAGQVLSKVGDVAEKYVGGVAKKLGVGTEEEALAEATRVGMPKETPTVLKRAEAKGNVVEKGVGPFKKEVVAPNQKDAERGRALLEAGVKESELPNQQIAKIEKRVTEQNALAASHISENPSTIHPSNIERRIDALKPSGAYETDLAAKNQYDKAKEIAMKEIHLRSKQLDAKHGFQISNEDVLQARQAFDEKAQDIIAKASSVENKIAAQRAVLDTRRAMNEVLIEMTPNGKEVISPAFRQQHLLLEAKTNIVNKSASTIGKTTVQQWAKANPIKTSLAAGATGAIVGGPAVSMGRKALGLGE